MGDYSGTITLMDSSPLEFLQNWVTQRTQSDRFLAHTLCISTIGNPGWSLVFDPASSDLKGGLGERFTVERTEDDWISAGAHPWKRFEAAGGPLNLEELLRAFQRAISRRQSVPKRPKGPLKPLGPVVYETDEPLQSPGPLTYLQQWYLAQCDGDWENYLGAGFRVTDDPGWWLNVNLTWTDLEGTAPERKVVHRSPSDWIETWPGPSSGYSPTPNFQAAGGPMNLEEMLQAFQDFAVANGSQVGARDPGRE